MIPNFAFARLDLSLNLFVTAVKLGFHDPENVRLDVELEKNLGCVGASVVKAEPIDILKVEADGLVSPSLWSSSCAMFSERSLFRRW